MIVIPGRLEEANPESRDSGFDASHRPGMTEPLYGHFTSGGSEDRMDSMLPPVLSPNSVPRS